MLHILLLQASTHSTTVEVTSLTNVYLALGGTLTAAILAALASRNAAKTAEKSANLTSTTAQRVADLSRQTTREVADLSAQVSRESAGLASQTAKEIKETDYKHDYYKKIIDRRIKAIEYAASLIALFRYYKRDTDELEFHAYFITELNSTKYGDAKNEIVLFSLWFSIDTLNLLRIFVSLLNESISEARKAKDEKDIISLAKSRYNDIVQKREAIVVSIGKDMATLHHVDAFISTRFQPAGDGLLIEERPTA